MSFRIDARWQRGAGFLSKVPEAPLDEATLAEISIWVNGDCLTRLRDSSGRKRDFVRVAGFRLAEWIGTNWWRLGYEAERWEHAQDHAWGAGHSVASIGAGWLWPRITIAADGDSVVIRSIPTEGDGVEPIAWQGCAEKRIPRQEFVEGAQDFVHAVLDRLDGQGEEKTDLHVLWKELIAERSDPEIARYRQLEGSMGYEPDRASPPTITRFHRDSEALGFAAMAEIAANGRSGDDPTTAAALEDQARYFGFSSDLGDSSVLADLEGPPTIKSEPAWKHGERAAQRVRRKASLGAGPVKNRRLADLCGADSTGLSDVTCRFEPLAFSLDANGTRGRFVLRSGHETGRRFELSRLLGDALLFGNGERLHPATRTETFRQRTQRAFAAELLCPYTAVSDFLEGRTSEAAVREAARHFLVSDRAVTTTLVNKGDLPRHRLPLAAG